MYEFFHKKNNDIINPLLDGTGKIFLYYQFDEKIRLNKHIWTSKNRNCDRFKETAKTFLNNNFYFPI